MADNLAQMQSKLQKWQKEEKEMITFFSTKKSDGGVLLTIKEKDELKKIASNIEKIKQKILHTTTEVQKIRQNYIGMISGAKKIGWSVAADNLQRFIDGKGGTKQVDLAWLRSFSNVITKESDILGYTEGSTGNKKNIKYWAKNIKENETIDGKDHWIGDIKCYSPTSELAYASGASKIRAAVSIKISRVKEQVILKGNVDMAWEDDYNWNKNSSFWIPGYGSISDNDGLYLKKHAGAKDFKMAAKWKFDYEGEYNVKTGVFIKNEWKINGAKYDLTSNTGTINEGSR